MGRQLERHTNKNHHFGLQAFLIALVTACVLIIPFIIFDGGVFYYYGDFNVQEIPFYQMVHDAIKSGNLGWNTTTDLGSDLISSYSFYLLGSPFFWLTIPFPSEAVPYLIGPLLILKLSLASLSAYLYLKDMYDTGNLPLSADFCMHSRVFRFIIYSFSIFMNL